MRRFAIGTVKHTVRAVGYGLLGAFVMLLGVAVFYLDSQPDLKVWHKTALTENLPPAGGCGAS